MPQYRGMEYYSAPSRSLTATLFARLPLHAEYAVSMAILVIIGLLLIWEVQRQRESILTDNIQTQTTLLRIAEADLLSSLRMTDHVLTELAAQHATNRLISAAQQPDFWPDYWRELPESSLLFATDTQGRVVAASQSNLIGRSVTDEDFFKHARDIPNNSRMILSKPARYFGEGNAIVLAHAVYALDGSWRGLVAVTLPVTNFEKMLQSFHLKPSQAATLQHESGDVLAHEPAVTKGTQTSKNIDLSLFFRHFSNGKIFSSHRFISDLDGQQKIGSALTVNTNPLRTDSALVLAISDSLDSVLNSWYKMLLALFLYIPIATMAAWFGYASFRRRRDNEAARALIDALLANPKLLVVAIRRSGKIAIFNEAASVLTGYGENKALNSDWFELLIPDHDRKAAREQFASLLAQPIARAINESTLLTAEGRKRIIVWQNSVIHDRKGPMVVSLGTDITQVRKREEELRTLAHIDSLTGIANRRHFLTTAEMAIEHAHQHGQFVSILMMDIDHFKHVNDTHGHPAGDEVLKAFARLCQRTVRDDDLVGRLGGEEFAILLPHTNPAAAHHIAERVRTQFAASVMTLDDGTEIRCTVSIGLAWLTAADSNCDDLLRRADEALYTAKNSGRNQVSESTEDKPHGT